MKINHIYCGDCLAIMKTFPDKSVDLIITDPPYGMNFQSNHRTTKHDKIIGDNRYPVEILKELFRLAKNAVYVFCRWDNLKVIGSLKEYQMSLGVEGPKTYTTQPKNLSG